MKTELIRVLVVSITYLRFAWGETNNLTCYQCIKNTNTGCDPQDLLPCPAISDRCVTHISKNAENGFSIKRECGLGPCGFNDDMVNKGLGFGACDMSREEFFCIFCCRESGCNASNSSSNFSGTVCLISLLILLQINCIL